MLKVNVAEKLTDESGPPHIPNRRSRVTPDKP